MASPGGRPRAEFAGIDGGQVRVDLGVIGWRRLLDIMCIIGTLEGAAEAAITTKTLCLTWIVSAHTRVSADDVGFVARPRDPRGGRRDERATEALGRVVRSAQLPCGSWSLSVNIKAALAASASVGWSQAIRHGDEWRPSLPIDRTILPWRGPRAASA